MRTLLLLAALPGLALAAASVAPTKDPLDKPLTKYHEQIKAAVARQYSKYEKVTQPRPELKALAKPEESLERLVEVELLGALPAGWLKTLNAKGAEAEQRGQHDGVDKAVPDEFKAYESNYVGNEPSGAPIRTGEEWGKGEVADPESFKAPYEELEKMQKKKKGGPVKGEAYDKAVRATESAFKHRVRGSVAKCLKTLAAAIQPAVKGAKPGPVAPWHSLNSPGIDKAAERYLAERYFKGKWLAGKSGPKNTSGKDETEISRQKETLSTATDKNAEGSTGNGESTKPPSDKGTGSAKPSAAPGTTGTGGGEVKTGSGTGPGY